MQMHSKLSNVMSVVMLVGVALPGALADDLRFRYEADVLPDTLGAGWAVFNACEAECLASVRDGHFVLEWSKPTDLVYYDLVITYPPNPPLPSLWVEWRYKSNHVRPRCCYTCDGIFLSRFRGCGEVLFMYGDSALPFHGGGGVSGLTVDEFHTFRFESLDGLRYTVSVDGRIFIQDGNNSASGSNYIQMGGTGGCGGDWRPNQRNEWDYVRYGTIAFGERIVASNPPSGFLDATMHPSVDRFTVAYDSPNYVYVHEITVESLGGPAPRVLQTRRLDNGPPEVVEIVLDRPVPTDGGTRIILDDDQTSNVVSYVYAPQVPLPPADADLDLDVDLHDLARLQVCFRAPIPPGAKSMTPCVVFDLDGNNRIDASDLPALPTLLTGPK